MCASDAWDAKYGAAFQAWKGRNAAIVALVGLATLWFNFIGINFFFGGDSKHSYAQDTSYVELLR